MLSQFGHADSFAASTLILLATSARAQSCGLSIATDAGDQSQVVAIADGAADAYVACVDSRIGGNRG